MFVDRVRILGIKSQTRSDSIVSKESELKVNDFAEGIPRTVFIPEKGLYSVINYKGKLQYIKYSDKT